MQTPLAFWAVNFPLKGELAFNVFCVTFFKVQHNLARSVTSTFHWGSLLVLHINKVNFCSSLLWLRGAWTQSILCVETQKPVVSFVTTPVIPQPITPCLMWIVRSPTTIYNRVICISSKRSLLLKAMLLRMQVFWDVIHPHSVYRFRCVKQSKRNSHIIYVLVVTVAKGKHG